MPQTVGVPEQLRVLFERSEQLVAAWFRRKSENPALGRIEIDDERYVLVRASSLSVEFYDLMRDLYGDEQQAFAAARNLLFHLSHSIGRSDARVFHRKLQLTEPLAKLSAGPVHFAHAGWAFVEIDAVSRPATDESFFLLYDHPYSFESASWAAAGRNAPFPICVMNTGYSSGWCEESYGIPLVATEIQCTARGDPCCRFVMAHPSHIEERVRDYLHEHPEVAARASEWVVPGEFEQKQLWDRLRLSEQKYRLLFDNAPSAVFGIENGRIDEVNRTATELFGLSRDELRGKSFTELAAPDAAPDDAQREALLRSMKAALEGEPQAFRCTCAGPQGRRIESEVRLNRIEGKAEGVLAVVRDVTAWVQAEAESRRLESELRQLQKMEAVGTLAGGIAHDFNNLLTGITCNIDLARRELPEGSKGRERLEAARAASDRASALVRQLLTFARASAGHVSIVEANAIAKETELIVRETFDSRISLSVTTSPESLPISGDANQLIQAVMNLILNARDALQSRLGRAGCDAGEAPSIRVEVQSATAESGRELVCIAVSDNGAGMDETVRARAFDPFFTTKPVGQGTGLGLTVTYGIVKRHGGWTELTSTPGQGTRACIFLPRTARRNETVPPTQPSGVELAGAETILFADDEALIRDVVSSELGALGYRIVLAEDGDEAVSKFELAQSRVSVVVLDLAMPGLSGKEAMQRILAIQPAARIVIASGNLTGAAVEELARMGARAFLPKPYTAGALAGAIRKVLAR